MSEKINIGALIRNKLDEDQRSIAWLGQKVHREKSALAKMLKKYSIDTKLLFDISHALQFDFFYCYSKNLIFPGMKYPYCFSR
ncbi:MAG: XRE family transcriptional regulator [Bacteroidales bacterium]|nr:XRE family transcriptional regulator [Bacteroidales bacterium]